MNRFVTIMSATMLCACGGARSAPSNDGTVSKEGVYEFSASIPTWQPGSSVQVKGTFSAFDDSVYVQTGPECVPYTPSERYRTPSTDRVTQIFCQGATLTFEKKNPTAVKWFSRVQVAKQRNTCVDYAPRPTAGGNTPRCLRWKPETYYVTQQRTGRVQVKRIT